MFNRSETLDFKRFIREGDYIGKQNKEVYKKITKSVTVYSVIGIPKLTFAATSASVGTGAFDELYQVFMNIFDGGVVLALVICGGTWAFGWRTQAIERIIYIAAGYILARHATDIRDFLKTI
ncbi:MAG: glycosyltransferase [Bacillaceae bacterium]|nr:glycosyltransferase [Bacillaceae bacterium]